MRQKCAVCPEPVIKKSGEHVFPEWLIKALGVKYSHANPILAGWGTSSAVDFTIDTGPRRLKAQRLHNYDNFKVNICEECNGGWMSLLENKTKAFLLPLIRGKRQLEDLSKSERATLMRWALKTAFMMNEALKTLGDEAESMIPASHGASLRRSDFPNGVCLLGQVRSAPVGPALDYELGKLWLPQVTQDKADEYTALARDDSYKFSLQLGRVSLLLAHWPANRGWQMALRPGHHHVIWQQECVFTEAPWPEAFGGEYPRPMAVFGTTLGISWGPWSALRNDHVRAAARLLLSMAGTPVPQKKPTPRVG